MGLGVGERFSLVTAWQEKDEGKGSRKNDYRFNWLNKLWKLI